MITNKMRAILKNDLGYRPEEIDDMEPQVPHLALRHSIAL
jgi:hypothetical protein